MTAFEVVKDVSNFAAGFVSLMLGIYNFRKRRSDKRATVESEAEELKLFAALVRQQQEQGSAVVQTVEPGSPQHAMAERMVRRGMLIRSHDGCTYGIRAT